MKKRLYIIAFTLLLVLFTGCKNAKRYKVTFMYENGDKIIEVKVSKGSSISYPNTKEIEGYYFEFDKTLAELSNIQSNIKATAYQKECDKVCRYYDGETLLKEETIKYTASSTAPTIEGVANPSWILTTERVNNVYYYTYTLDSGEEFEVIFEYENGRFISSEKVKYGSKVEYPNLGEEEGYYYDFDSDGDLNHVTSNITVVVSKLICDKDCTFYIDDKLVDEQYLEYFEKPQFPANPKGTTNQVWNEVKERIDNIYYVKYTLSYDILEPTITYYDDGQVVDLLPNKFTYGEKVTLPSYSKPGYEFLGWYISDISNTSCSEVGGYCEDNIKVYAKFVQTSGFKEFVLPESSGNFTGIRRVENGSGTYVYQPVFPTTANSQVTLYDWSTSDSSIATVSTWSSISAKKAGYCVLTATLKTNHNYKINCVIHVTSSGIEFSNVNEANNHILYNVTFLGKNDEVIAVRKAEKWGAVIPPTPLSYDGFAFVGWDKDVFNITEDTQIHATYVEGSNPYVGKKISIIGDSISTYEEYVPEGYKTFYPYPTADVSDVNLTWWMKAINKLGGKLFINNSYSGSCVSTGGSSASQSMERLSKLVVNGETPDVIIIYMGSNDCHAPYTVNSFKSAYKKMLTNLKQLCPNSEIVLCTLPTSNLYTKENQNAYNNVITEFATNYKLVNLDKVDITNYLVDSAHPNKDGMEKIAEQIVKDMLK